MSSCTSKPGAFNTGNDLLILHEVRHALTQLIETDQPTTIDLRSIPMAPGEEAHIEAMLGTGEISATLNALGYTSIVETQIAGVWLITHYNSEDDILGKFIEITRVPSLISSPTEEIDSGLQQLTEMLSSKQSSQEKI